MISRQGPYWRVLSWCLLLIGGIGYPALGEPTEKELQLQQKVESLEARLAKVEALLAQMQSQPLIPSPPVAPDSTIDLERRIADLEKTAEKIEGPSIMIPQWKDGLRIASNDKRHEVQIGGRIHNDWFFGDEGDAIQDLIGPLDDGAEFRRARLYLKGYVHENIEFKMEYDFAGGDAAFKDLYFGVKEFPGLGAGLRIGYFKEPFGLEALASSNDVTFLERALPNALIPFRNTGVMFHDSIYSDRMTWAVGAFRSDSDDYGNGQDGSEGGEYAFTGRVTALPFYANDGRCLLHLGTAISHRNPDGDTIRYRRRPEAHLAPYFLDTGTYGAEEVNLYGAEAAMVWGPTSVQAEWIKAETQDTQGFGDPDYDGFYVYLSHFLTGENRHYKTSAGSFDRVKPNKDFLDGGCGALELAARYSHLDLNDGSVAGGVLDDYTVGLNWYWNPNTRVMFNYVYADVARDDLGLDEDASLFQLRFQFDF